MHQKDIALSDVVTVVNRRVSSYPCPHTGVPQRSVRTFTVVELKSNAKFQCSDCQVCFLTEEEYQKHLKYRGQCTVSKSEVNKALMGKNMVIVDKAADFKLPFVCKLCEEKFDTAPQIHAHLSKCHAEVLPSTKRLEKLYGKVECPVCSKMLQRHGVPTHLWVAHEIKYKTRNNTFKCETCGFKAMSACVLQEHIKNTHLDVRDFMCDTCGTTFGNIYKLKSHIRIHTNERLYKCDHCGKSFRKSIHLRQHVPLHTGWKPYQCKLCDKAFVQLTSINLHLKTHHPQVPKEKWKENREYVRMPGLTASKCNSSNSQ